MNKLLGEKSRVFLTKFHLNPNCSFSDSQKVGASSRVLVDLQFDSLLKLVTQIESVGSADHNCNDKVSNILLALLRLLLNRYFNSHHKFRLIIPIISGQTFVSMREFDPQCKVYEYLRQQFELDSQESLNINLLEELILNNKSLRNICFAEFKVNSMWETPNAFAIQPDFVFTLVGRILTMEFNEALISSHLMSQFGRHLNGLIEASLANQDSSIGTLEYMEATELDLLLNSFSNQVECWQHRKVKCLSQLFEEQVRWKQNAVALLSDSISMTYGELNCRSNQMAWYLRRIGVSRETIVAVCAQNPVRAMVAILAVLKAGGCYLPLDPKHPLATLRHKLQDANAKLLISDCRLDFRLPGLVVLHSDCPAWLACEPIRNLDCISRPGDLAYIMYTSGSTGPPKGVLIEQAGVAHIVGTLSRDILCLQAGDRVLQFASSSFDASVWEMWGCWLAGATLCLTPPSGPEQPLLLGYELSRFIRTHSINVVSFVPSVLLTMEKEFPDCIQVLVLGGEVCPPHLVRKCMAARPGLTCVNMYGPTEATITATVNVIRASSSSSECDMPNNIGKPIVPIYLLDHLSSPVPIGVVGEICIGGVGLARGYLNNPQLTRRKFFRFNGVRLYRSGDLGRWLPDGSLQFVGRVDQQIKCRGLRIEAAEVEACIVHVLGQAATRVFVRLRQQSLVAYIALSSSSGTLAPHFESKLRARLAQYLTVIPDRFVFLNHDDFPLTSNGKVDLDSLPIRPMDTDLINSELINPEGHLEKLLASIWRQVVHATSTNADTDFVNRNFFEIGGNSLSAAFVCNRIQDSFAIPFTTEQLFRNPTIRKLAKVIQPLIKAQPEISVNHDEENSVAELNGLSFAQEQIWLHLQMSGNPKLYNECATYRSKFRVNVDQLKQQLKHLIRKHDVLRCGFFVQSADRICVQEADDILVEISQHDLTKIETLSEQRAKMLEIQLSCLVEPFDLSRPPLFRISLIHRTHDTILFLVFHHLILDGLSVSNIFLNELNRVNQAHADQSRGILSYKTHAALERKFWQNSGSEHFKNCGKFWMKYLDRMQPFTFNKANNHLNHFDMNVNNSNVSFEFPQELCCRLAALCRETETTLFVVALSAFSLLLCRLFGQNDLVIGCAFTGRSAAVLEDVLGHFARLVPIRTTFANGSLSVKEFLRQMHEMATCVHQFHEFPLQDILKLPHLQSSVIPNTVSGTLFDVVLIVNQYSEAPKGEQQDWQLDWESLANPIDFGMAKFPSTLVLNTKQNRHEAGSLSMCGHFNFDAKYFGRDAVECWVRCFMTLLAQMTTDRPSPPIGSLSLVSSAEQHSILHTLSCNQNDHKNKSRTELGNTNLYQLVESTCIQTPNSVAIVFKGERLTYGQLNSQIDKFATQLRLSLIKADSVVAIELERSPAYIVAILAVLKTGAAYLPLHKRLPVQRTRLMLAETGATAVITDRCTTDDPFPDLIKIRIRGDGDQQQPECNSDELAFAFQQGSERAYVMYTSGTTGAPKGIQVTHGNVLNCLRSFQDSLLIDKQPVRWLAVSTFTFDISVLEIFLPMLCGGTIVLAPEDAICDIPGLVRLLDEYEVTYMQATPSLWSLLVANAPEGWRSRELVAISGGEPLSAELASRLLVKCRTLWNAYGPTETSIWSACKQVTGSETRITIGRPIANTKLYILDSCMQIVPVGVPGELYIGGRGVSLGYLNQPELQEQRFVRNPFANSGTGELIYRTGDMAVWGVDGDCILLGRTDSQVKVRGHRVELGEIECVLRQQSAVRDAGVVLDQNSGSLVAYFTARTEICAQESDHKLGMKLRRELSAILPKYMIPSRFVQVAEFPLTLSGKLDKSKLPTLTNNTQCNDLTLNGNSDSTVEEPALKKMWASVLDICPSSCKITDNFFQLGGHSHAAIQFISMLKAQFGYRLSFSDFLAGPTIAEIVDAMNNNNLDSLNSNNNDNDSNQPAIVDDCELFRLSASQEQIHLFQSQRRHEDGVANVCLCIDMNDTSLDRQALTLAIIQVIHKHPAWRTKFCRVQNKLMQSISKPSDSNPQVSYTDLIAWEGQQREQEKITGSIAKEMAKNLAAVSPDNEQHFENGLFRFHLIRLTETCFRLLIVAHHLITDGTSLSHIFVHDLKHFYRHSNKCDPNRRRLSAHNSTAVDREYKALISSSTVERLMANGIHDKNVITRAVERNLAQRSSSGLWARRTHFEISAEILQSVQENNPKMSLYVSCLSAFAKTMQEMRNETDSNSKVCFGIIDSGRSGHSMQHQSVSGCFINVLLFCPPPLNSDIESTNREFIQTMKCNLPLSFWHYKYGIPFQNLWPRILFNFEPMANKECDLNWAINNQFQGEPQECVPSKFELVVELQQKFDPSSKSKNSCRLVGKVEYKTSTYSESEISVLISQLETNLRNLALV